MTEREAERKVVEAARNVVKNYGVFTGTHMDCLIGNLNVALLNVAHEEFDAAPAPAVEGGAKIAALEASAVRVSGEPDLSKPHYTTPAEPAPPAAETPERRWERGSAVHDARETYRFDSLALMERLPFLAEIRAAEAAARRGGIEECIEKLSQEYFIESAHVLRSLLEKSKSTPDSVPPTSAPRGAERQS